MDGGISATPYPAGVGDEVQIIYSGLLSRHGADKVYLHAGYASNDTWSDVTDYEMTHTSKGWETSFKVQRAGRLSFCFKDRANNWDNNNGHNWSYQIDPNRFKYS
jgi:hypothetical protein